MILPECFTDTNLHTSVVCVRKDGVKCYVDGKLIVKWNTNYTDMGTDIWKLKNVNVLGLGAHNSHVRFEKIVIKEISGKGKVVEPGQTEGGAF